MRPNGSVLQVHVSPHAYLGHAHLHINLQLKKPYYCKEFAAATAVFQNLTQMDRAKDYLRMESKALQTTPWMALISLLNSQRLMSINRQENWSTRSQPWWHSMAHRHTPSCLSSEGHPVQPAHGKVRVCVGALIFIGRAAEIPGLLCCGASGAATKAACSMQGTMQAVRSLLRFLAGPSWHAPL